MSTQGAGSADAPGIGRRRSLDPLLLERLAETGFLATEFGMDDHAEQIFGCLARLRPGESSPLIALAMVHARRGWMAQAIGELRELLTDRPDCEMAKAVLATMLVHDRQPGALQLCEEVLANDTDSRAADVVRCCIELARQQEAQPGAPNPESLEFFRHYNLRA
jgi:thioredoxin-like negative regulator of GroEL